MGHDKGAITFFLKIGILFFQKNKIRYEFLGFGQKDDFDHRNHFPTDNK